MKKNDSNKSEKSFSSSSINWFPGHMQKTKRQIGELLPIIDVVYELIDSRILGLFFIVFSISTILLE